MLKRLLPLLALVLALGACADADPDAGIAAPDVNEEVRADDGEGADGPITESVDDVFDALLDDGFSGLVMINDGGDVNTAGFGLADREADVSWDENTVFTVGSITKQFTAAAILRLEMDGLLSVEDRLGDHLPDVSGELADVTLHQLLTHTGGLPDGLGDDFAPTSSADIVGLSNGAVEAGDVGTTFRYSNPGYSLLGVVIEEVTGDGYERYLHDALFEPAGMTNTGYLLPDWSDDVVAVGYEGERAWGRPIDKPWADDGPHWHLRANGGILSTGVDMLAWHRALLGDDILDEAAKAKLYDRHVAEDPGGGEWSYGYGWSNVDLPDGGTLITHNGGNGIFFADFLRFLDDDLTILVATNEARVDENVAYRIADAVRGTDYSQGSVVCAPDTVADLEVLADLPDGPRGETLAALQAAVTTADDAERRAFATDHVNAPLIADLSVEEVSAEILLVQEELTPFTFADVRRSDDDTYHLVFTGTADTDGDAVISAVIDPDDPSSITCVDVGFGY
ncbi:MAG: serine hydrolase domain-containing protein [Actinomycetota bacterium]